MDIAGSVDYNNITFVTLGLKPFLEDNDFLKIHIVGGVMMSTARPAPPKKKTLWMRIPTYPGQYRNNVIVNGSGRRQLQEREPEAFHLGRTEDATYPFYSVDFTLTKESKSGRVILCGSATYGYGDETVVCFRLHGMTTEPVGKVEELQFGFKDREMWGRATAFFVK